MHMDHKFSEIDHVTPLFNLFLVVHLPTHSVRVPVLVTNNGARGRMNFQKTAGRSGRETQYLQAAALVCHCLSVPRPISPRRLSVLSSQPQSYCNHVTSSIAFL